MTNLQTCAVAVTSFFAMLSADVSLLLSIL